MTPSSYETAWLVYLLSASGIVIVLWRWMRRWPPALRHLLCISAIVLLVTPYVSDADKQTFAPAFLISGLNLAFGEHEQATNAAKPLLALLLVGMMVSLVYSFTQRKKRR